MSYELFYGTRHINGLRAMKDAMWKVDDTGLFRFSDRRIGIIDMFGGPDAARARCKSEMVTQLAGKTKTVDQVEEFVLAETPFASGHFKKPLADLEKEGRLTVVSSSRKRNYTFPDGTTVKFLP